MKMKEINEVLHNNLAAQMYLWNNGIRPWSFSYILNL